MPHGLISGYSIRIVLLGRAVRILPQRRRARTHILSATVACMTETRSCVRARKMTVTTAVSGGKIGVAEAYGATIQLPYLSTLSPLPAVGDSVWVRYYMDDLSTAVIVSKGDGL